VVVGLAVGWWIDRTSLYKQMRRQKSDEQMRHAFDSRDFGRR